MTPRSGRAARGPRCGHASPASAPTRAMMASSTARAPPPRRGAARRGAGLRLLGRHCKEQRERLPCPRRVVAGVVEERLDRGLVALGRSLERFRSGERHPRRDVHADEVAAELERVDVCEPGRRARGRGRGEARARGRGGGATPRPSARRRRRPRRTASRSSPRGARPTSRRAAPRPRWRPRARSRARARAGLHLHHEPRRPGHHVVDRRLAHLTSIVFIR